MSTLIKLRRSAVPGRVPTTAQLELGEIAINTADGKIYIKQEVGGTPSIVEFSADPSDLLDLLKGVDGANSGLDADLLDGQQGSYYLDYNNFTNTPANTNILESIKDVDGSGSGLDADLLDGIDSTQFLRSDEDDTFDGNLTITGDLTVTGNTTYVNTEEILLSDNVIVLNANFTGPTASENAGIEVERGGETNVVLQWNETQNYWEIASGGVAGRILTTGDEGSGNGLDSDTLDGQEGTYYLDWTNTTNKPDPQIDVNISGKVTGSGSATLTDLGNGTINISAELANTAVVPGTYGTASQIPIITVDEDGRLTAASNVAVAGVESLDWYTANNTFEIRTVDGNVFHQDIDTFGTTIDVSDIVVTGTVDGRDVSVDGAKLDTIQSGAQVNPSNTEIFEAILTLDGAGSGLDADLLDGANGTFYLDYTNFTNTPSDADILNQIKNVDGAGSGLDADLLDGANSTFYLDYNNFFNVPAATFDLTLTGKVTGTAFSNTGVMTLSTELANTGVVAGTYGTASQIPVFTVDEDGRLTAASNVAVAGVDSTLWTSSNNTFTIETVDGGVYNTVIDSFNDITANDVTINDLSANNISVAGLVDGRDIAADGSKLDGIESGATADQTAAEILAELLTVDGTGSTLDADLLDGQHGSHYLNFSNFTNLPDPQISLTLSGEVTGTGSTTLTDLGNGSISITTALRIMAVAPAVYGSASQIPVITIDADGRITTATVTAISGGVSSTNWYSSNNTFEIGTSDGTLYKTVISSFASISTGNIGVTGNITITGNVDGRDVSADGTKLDTIQAGAQVNPSNTEIFNTVLSLDGPGSGLNADLLDGLHAAEIAGAGANAAIASIGDGTVTITANSGLIGAGTFNLNDFSNTAIDISHADTSSVADVNNSNGFVIQDLTFDTFGHVQTVGSVDLDGRYYTETELDNGQLDTRYYTETELDNGQLDNRYYTETELDNGQLDTRYYTETETNTLLNGKVDNTVNVLAGTGLSGGGPLTANVTISHGDTSSVANTGTLDLANAEVISAMTFDEFGHVQSVTTGNLSVLTQTIADTRYVNVDGDTMTGDLTVPTLYANTIVTDSLTLTNDLITLENAAHTSGVANTTSTSATDIFSFDSTTYNSAEVIITATQGINRHITKLLIVHNGTTASATEFATIYTNNSLASYAVGLSGGNVNVTVTAASTTATEYKIAATLIID